MLRIRQWLTRFSLPSERGEYRPALILALSLGGLIVVIAVMGIAALAINQNVHNITVRALEYDIEIEDEGDDLRAAILDLRHYHRDIAFEDPRSSQGIANLTRAYHELENQIRDYADIDIDPEESVIPPEDLQALAENYWITFRPAIDLYDTDRAAFDKANAEGLALIQEMEEEAQVVDRLGEALAEASLGNVNRSNYQSRLILFGVVAGLVLTGAGLAWVTIRVITQFRKLYNSQQAASSQLSQALKAKSDFIADASHELRTPLTVLRGNAEAGLAMDPNSVHREILVEIVTESARMTKLVEDLLFLARSDADSVPLDIEPVAAEPMLLERAERARILARRHGASLATQLDGYGTLNVDAARIEQAVMILLDNAAKYSPAGGTVRLATSSWRNEFIVEVADQGPGIGKADIPLVFERFRRVDKVRNRRLGGTGLGLAIASTIVNAHRGRIEVHSRVGEGTQMRIYLPIDADKVRRPKPAPVSRPIELAP